MKNPQELFEFDESETATEEPQSAAPSGPVKSRGHVGFYTYEGTQYEVYKDANGNLYRAPVGNVIDLDTGNRIGRWEAPAHMADKQAEVLLAEAPHVPSKGRYYPGDQAEALRDFAVTTRGKPAMVLKGEKVTVYSVDTSPPAIFFKTQRGTVLALPTDRFYTLTKEVPYMRNPATLEDFETPEVGDRVEFLPADAAGGNQGLRKVRKAKVLAIRDGMATVEVRGTRRGSGQWFVPVNKLRRHAGDMKRELKSAQRKEAYSGLARGEGVKLARCAKDARRVAEDLCIGGYQGPITPKVRQELVECREKAMQEVGITDTTDKGQCRALAHFVGKALRKGQVPQIGSVEFVSEESGNIGQGDAVKIGGHRFEIAGHDAEGNVRLSDDYEVQVPPEYIPRDVGSAEPARPGRIEISEDERPGAPDFRLSSAPLATSKRRPPRSTHVALAKRRPRPKVKIARHPTKRRSSSFAASKHRIGRWGAAWKKKHCKPHWVWPRGSTVKHKGKQFTFKGLARVVGRKKAQSRWQHSRKQLPGRCRRK